MSRKKSPWVEFLPNSNLAFHIKYKMLDLVYLDLEPRNRFDESTIFFHILLAPFLGDFDRTN